MPSTSLNISFVLFSFYPWHDERIAVVEETTSKLNLFLRTDIARVLQHDQLLHRGRG